MEQSTEVPSMWQGKRVRLRAVELADWKIHWEWNKDSEQARRAYFVPFPSSQEAVRRWTEKEAVEGPQGDVFRFQIQNLTGELVGTINTHSCEPRNGTFGYGLAIRAEHQRKGYASEAIQLVLRYFFEELRYQKATVHVYSFNEPSIRLHEHVGFQREGCVRRMIYTQGQYFDDIIFGITAEEFAMRNGHD